jgi:hypothetical protein
MNDEDDDLPIAISLGPDTSACAVAIPGLAAESAVATAASPSHANLIVVLRMTPADERSTSNPTQETVSVSAARSSPVPVTLITGEHHCPVMGHWKYVTQGMLESLPGIC